MSYAAWIPLIVAIVGLVGGAFVYQLQKSIDRANQIRQERRALYRQFVTAHSELSHLLLMDHDTNAQMTALNALEKVIAEIYVTAPDPVVEACREVTLGFSRLGTRKYASTEARSDEAIDEAQDAVHTNYLNVVEAMRHDSFEHTKISRQTLERLLRDVLISLGRF